jgi:hypothetical protein
MFVTQYNDKKIKRQLKYLNEKISNYLKELDSNDQEEADIHIPNAEEIKKRIEELKNAKPNTRPCKKK